MLYTIANSHFQISPLTHVQLESSSLYWYIVSRVTCTTNCSLVLILSVYITYLTSQKFILFMTEVISKDDLSSILPRHVSGLLLSHQYHVISHTVNVILLHIQVFNTVNCQRALFSQASSMLVFVNDQVKLASCMSSFSITLHRFIVAPPSFRST